VFTPPLSKIGCFQGQKLFLNTSSVISSLQLLRRLRYWSVSLKRNRLTAIQNSNLLFPTINSTNLSKKEYCNVTIRYRQKPIKVIKISKKEKTTKILQNLEIASKIARTHTQVNLRKPRGEESRFWRKPRTHTTKKHRNTK
jgi:hypothetical protein